jgi:serine/threonine-protein kinase
MSSRAREYPPGERVPGTVYQVHRTIGAGGMGTVYDVEDTTIGKRYVLKVLHPQLGAREDLAKRMQTEARQLARLHHPNIVEVITAGVTGDDLKLPYYVMERLDGRSLRYSLDKRGQLELPNAYHIAIDLLDALDHAHDKGVIHRDVKPDNIFLHHTHARITVTKLLDFGIVSLLDATVRETAGRFLGTLRYAAPEQLRGEKPTPKVDVYSAALVLYEMVAGRGPFDDEKDVHRVAAAHLHKPAPPLSQFANVPKELDALVAAALSKLPEQRPRDAFSFAASLRNMKRALGGSMPSIDSTENRATAAAAVVAAPAVAPYVHVQQPTPEGPYVISPAAPVPQTTASPMAGALATEPGMAPPTLGPPLASATLPRMPSSPSIDRLASTHTYAPDPQRAPQNGTAGIAAYAPTPTLPANMHSPTPPMAFQWPQERPGERSIGPQVRTLSLPAPRGQRATAPIVAGVLVMGALAALSVALVVVRMQATTAQGLGRPPAEVVTTVPEQPSAAPVVAMPAPTLPPPALDDPPAAAASALPSTAQSAPPPPAVSAPPAAATAKVPVFTATPPKPASPPPAAPAATRPGPGF